MDQWDPMKEAYENRNFNCYNQGVGRDLMGSSRINKGVSLCVQSIPPNLGKVGFFNMFAEYGKVIQHKLISSGDDESRGLHGYITYENMLDAETAISHLDKKKLGRFTLKVFPALTEEEKNRRRKLKQDEETMYSSIRRDISARANDITSSSSSFPSAHQDMEGRSSRQINESSSLQHSDLKVDTGSWHQQSKHIGVGRGNSFQGMEREDARHHPLHSMGQRDLKLDTGNWHQQSKHVGIGRGNSSKGMDREDASHHPLHSMGQRAHGFYASQENLAYHQNHTSHGYQHSPAQESYQGADDHGFVRKSSIITPPKGPKSRGICIYCYTEECVYKCSSCKMYYCSNVCQKMDWPRHMEICVTLGRINSRSNLDLSSIPHVSRMENANGGYFDDDAEVNLSQDTKVQKTYRDDKSCSSDNTVFEAKGQGMRNFNEYHRGEHSTSTETVDRSLNTAKFQKSTNAMIKGNDYANKNDFHRSQKAKTAFSDEPGQSQVVNSSNYKRNIQSNHGYRHQDERATAEFSQKFSKSTNNRNNSNSNSFETKEAVSRTHTVSVSSCQETQVKDVEAPSKTKGKESMRNESRNPDCQSRHEEQNSSLGNQKQNTKKEDGKNTGSESAAVKACDKLPSTVELSLAVKAFGQCYLTYFESPYKFWISLQDYLEIFTESTIVMGQVISETSSTLQVACKVGGTYGVMYMGEWCRVTVKSVKGREITVFFIDYGNQATVKQEDLRLLTVEMLELPAQAVCCCISKLKPKGSDSWSEAASSAMQQWFGEPMSTFLQFEVVAKRGSIHAVTISHNKKSVSDVLLAGGFAEKVDAQPGLPNLTSSAASRLMADALASRIDGMKSGDQITGMFTDFTSAEKFIVQDVAASHLMDDLTSSLQSEYKNNTVPYKPVQGELVAAQFSDDGNWYRAEVINIDGENCTLYFVDYGNSEVQKVENIRHVTNKMLISAPKQALVCSLFTARSLAGYSSKIVNQELQKLLAAAVSSEGYVSLLVKDKTKDALLVDIIAKFGQSLSDELTHKLSKLSNETLNKSSERLIDGGQSIKKANKLSSSPSKAVLENVVTLSDLGTETLAEESGKTISVFVTFVESPLEFYVRLNSKNGLFISMMNELNKSVTSSPRLSVPSVGSLTAVQFSENGIWCRGIIEKIENKTCLVCFLDYGNCEETLLSDLKVLPSSVCHLPAQAIRCRLNGRLKNLPKASILEFEENLEESSVDVKVLRDDTGFFSVQVFQGGIDIGASVIDSCSQHTSILEATSAGKHPHNISGILMETLPAIGEPVTAIVTHIDSCSRLFIVCKDVMELMLQLNESADSLPLISNPVVGSICAAQYSLDSTWYRARIIDINSPKTCIVQFLDYGNSEETLRSNLRELDPDMKKLPGQAICCCLFGYEPDISVTFPCRPDVTELTNNLRLELLEKKVIVRAVERKSDTWIVKLENEHGVCIHTKYQPSSPEIAITPKLSDFTFETPPDAEFEAFIVHINSLSDFYCQMYDVEMLAELDSLSEHLRDDVSRLDGDILIDPVVNGVYTSKYTDTWYRCVVEEVRNTKVLIRYIDYGNSEEIPASQLRPLSPRRLQMPVRLLRCKLYGVTPVQENWTSPEMPDYLEILRQNKINLAIESRDADVFHVSVFIIQDSGKVSVAADLVDMGLAKFLQVVSPQKDESRSFVSDPQKPQQIANEQEDDDESIEEELQRKIQELQMQLMLSKQKKKQK